MATHAHEIVIVGGANAGLSVAARLRRAEPRLDIAVIDPAACHYRVEAFKPPAATCRPARPRRTRRPARRTAGRRMQHPSQAFSRSVGE